MKALSKKFGLRARNPPTKTAEKTSKAAESEKPSSSDKKNEKAASSNNGGAAERPPPIATVMPPNSPRTKDEPKPKSPQEQAPKISQFNKEAGNELFQNLFRKRASVVLTPADGFMLKQSRRGNWQSRWFSFRNPSLVYWKHEPKPDEPPDVVIDLRRVRRLNVEGLEVCKLKIIINPP
jgi:hypothetical protein